VFVRVELAQLEVFEVLKSAAKCKHDKLSRTVSFEELGSDSLDGVELVPTMEEHFGFDLTNEEAARFLIVSKSEVVVSSFMFYFRCSSM
jgi:acyl carrier protein